jgi:hypothetical protein
VFCGRRRPEFISAIALRAPVAKNVEYVREFAATGASLLARQLSHRALISGPVGNSGWWDLEEYLS